MYTKAFLLTLIASLGVASASPTPAAPAAFTDVQSLIQKDQLAINTVINDIAQQNYAAAHAAFPTVEGISGEIFQAVVPQGSCPPSTIPPPPSSVSDNQKISLLQDQQINLIKVSQDVINSDSSAAKTDICQVLALNEALAQLI